MIIIIINIPRTPLRGAFQGPSPPSYQNRYHCETIEITCLSRGRSFKFHQSLQGESAHLIYGPHSICRALFEMEHQCRILSFLPATSPILCQLTAGRTGFRHWS